MANKKKKTKRHIRKSILISGILVIAVVIALILVPRMRTTQKLKALGYDRTTIQQIRKQNLSKEILEHSYYSVPLAKAIRSGSIEKEYINLYAAVREERELAAKDFLLYARLEDKGYEYDQLENLFSKLSFRELTPLLLYTYQWDENKYIDDVISHQESENPFDLSGNYFSYPSISKDGVDKTPEMKDTSAAMLVNAQNKLNENYVPDTVAIDTQYAVANVSLEKEAAEAFLSFVKSGIQNGHYFYITSGYRSYETQQAGFKQCCFNVKEGYEDRFCTREGHSEHQTGLAFNVASTYETSVSFEETEVYAWMLQNCTQYGFIARYPSDLYPITGITDEPDHFRYVGKEIAEEYAASNLSYDEFYALYLAEWQNESYKPSASIINASKTTS